MSELFQQALICEQGTKLPACLPAPTKGFIGCALLN